MTAHESETPAVTLAGTSTLAIVHAIPEFEARTKRKATVIGGLAVLCRLGAAYRATSDLDTANRIAVGEIPQIDLLLLEDGVTRAGPRLSEFAQSIHRAIPPRRSQLAWQSQAL
jgi:hypothetical protein